jgi:hypothetical protein
MAQFDVYELRGEGLLVADIQADLVSAALDTRLVAPLFMPEEVSWEFSRLTPKLRFEGTDYRLAVHLIVAIPKGQLRGPLGSFASERYTILNAVDFLLAGI